MFNLVVVAEKRDVVGELPKNAWVNEVLSEFHCLNIGFQRNQLRSNDLDAMQDRRLRSQSEG